jgi:hypothetical protein
MLFPAWSFALRDGEFRAARQEELAGRQALVVDYVSRAQMVTDRFWVDAATGLILRWEDLPATRTGENVQPTQVIEVTQIVYDVTFLPGLFDLEATPPREFSSSFQLNRLSQP